MAGTRCRPGSRNTKCWADRTLPVIAARDHRELRTGKIASARSGLARAGARLGAREFSQKQFSDVPDDLRGDVTEIVHPDAARVGTQDDLVARKIMDMRVARDPFLDRRAQDRLRGGIGHRHVDLRADNHLARPIMSDIAKKSRADGTGLRRLDCRESSGNGARSEQAVEPAARTANRALRRAVAESQSLVTGALEAL